MKLKHAYAGADTGRAGVHCCHFLPCMMLPQNLYRAYRYMLGKIFSEPKYSELNIPNILCWTAEVSREPFLAERDYVTFGSLLSQIRLSSVTFVHPTHGVETFGNISSPFCTLAIFWPPCKILGSSSTPRGTSPLRALNARVVTNRAVSHSGSGITSPDEFLVYCRCYAALLDPNIGPHLKSLLKV